MMKIALLMALLALSACTRTMEGRELSTSGNRALFDDAVIAKISEGKSTKADVRATYGVRNDVLFSPDGAETWRYVSAISRMQTMTVGMTGYTGGQTNMDTRTISVLFDNAGIVRKLGVGQSRSCGGPSGSTTCPQ